MILYHFTESRNVPLIKDYGINVGVVPYGDGTKHRYVSLTGVLNPFGHGLFLGDLVFEGDKEFEVLSECFPSLVGCDSGKRCVKMPDKTEVAIEIELDNHDPNLITFENFIVDALRCLGFPPSEKAIATLMAETVVSGKYHLGQMQVDENKILRLIELERDNPTHHNLQWFFYRTVIPSSKITRILHKQPDGSYK